MSNKAHMSNKKARRKNLPHKATTCRYIPNGSIHKGEVAHAHLPIKLDVSSFLSKGPNPCVYALKDSCSLTDCPIHCYAKDQNTVSVSGSDGTLYERAHTSASISENQPLILAVNLSKGEHSLLESDQLYPQGCKSYPNQYKELIKLYLTLADEDIETFGIEWD